MPQCTSGIYVLEKRILALEAATHQAASAEGRPEDVKQAAVSSPETVTDQVRVMEPIFVRPEAEPTAPPPAPVSVGSAIPVRPSVYRAASVTGEPVVGTAYARSADPVDLENRIAGNWFNRIVIVAMLIAISSGLKWAFDNNVIGPSGRVAIGVLLGALLLPWSQWLLGKGYSYFSEGIAALGEAKLFLSARAGCQYYTLYSRDLGVAAMIVITRETATAAF